MSDEKPKKTFDNSKDEILKEWTIKVRDNSVLSCSVRRYGNGEPKFQIGPMIYENDDGEKKFGKTKRLEWGQLLDLQDRVLPEAVDFIDTFYAKGKHKKRC